MTVWSRCRNRPVAEPVPVAARRSSNNTTRRIPGGTARVMTMATTVTSTDMHRHFCKLVRQVEETGEPLIITRRGKVVAKLAPVSEDSRPGNIATDLHGLFADCPEACDEIDKVYAERYKHKPRYAEL